MNIAFDGRTIDGWHGGIGLYAEATIRGLVRIGVEHRFHLLVRDFVPGFEAPNLSQVRLPGYADKKGANRLWENVQLPSYLRRHHIDILFSPAFILPLVLRRGASPAKQSRRTRTAVAIHDIISMVLPETMTPKMIFLNRLFIRHAVRHADLVVASSESTRRDILNVFGAAADPARVRTLLLARDPLFTAESDPVRDAHVKEKFSLPEHFILYVGTIEPRKNVPALCEAYAALPEALRNEWRIVLCGHDGWYVEEINRRIDALGLGDRIVRIGYIDREDMPALYRHAGLFVFPSKYEGFGYPPLEAMACGTPVMSSNRSSLPEVTGDAALLFDPDDVSALTRLMTDVLSSDAVRASLREKGLVRCEEFSPIAYARALLAMLQDACAT